MTREWRLKENKYKSRFRINGVLVNRSQISDLRSNLFDFTLQGDTYILNDPLYQLNLLDEKDIVEFSSCVIAGFPYNNSLDATPAPDKDKSLGKVYISIASKPIANKLKEITNKYFLIFITTPHID